MTLRLALGLAIALSLPAYSCVFASDNQADRYLDAHEVYTGASCPLAADGISNFVYFSRDREGIQGHALLTNSRFAGAQIERQNPEAWHQRPGCHLL